MLLAPRDTLIAGKGHVEGSQQRNPAGRKLCADANGLEMQRAPLNSAI